MTWWRHQTETFSALLAFCAGNSPETGEFPAQRPVRRSFDVFFDLRLKQQLSKHWRRRWFETLSRSLWRHCNDTEASLLSDESCYLKDRLPLDKRLACHTNVKLAPDSPASYSRIWGWRICCQLHVGSLSQHYNGLKKFGCAGFSWWYSARQTLSSCCLIKGWLFLAAEN